MSFLLTIAITALLSYPNCVNGGTATKGSVTNFATWATYENVCDTPGTSSKRDLDSPPPMEPQAACAKAASDGYDDTQGNHHDPDNTWDAMCTALDGFQCEDNDKAKGEIKEFDSCCTASDGCLQDTTDTPDNYQAQASCCADCITASQTTTPTTHSTASPTAPGPKPAPTGEPTTVAPGPGPTPSPSEPETTTGPSEGSTENVTEPDSAYHLGPNGLLVTLFAMMAAVVNIA